MCLRVCVWGGEWGVGVGFCEGRRWKFPSLLSVCLGINWTSCVVMRMGNLRVYLVSGRFDPFPTPCGSLLFFFFLFLFLSCLSLFIFKLFFFFFAFHPSNASVCSAFPSVSIRFLLLLLLFLLFLAFSGRLSACLCPCWLLLSAALVICVAEPRDGATGALSWVNPLSLGAIWPVSPCLFPPLSLSPSLPLLLLLFSF